MIYSYDDLLKDKKAVLFDLDGTLVDSMWVWRDIDIDFLSVIGKELPDDLQKCIEGMSFTETAEYFKKRFGIKDDVEDIKAKWNKMAYDKYTSEVRLKKGAKEFLKRLKADGISTGIASSNSMTLIEGADKAVIRPEFVKISKFGKLDRYMSAAETGIVEDVVFRGNRLDVTIDVHGIKITGEWSLEKDSLEIGEKVNLLIYRIYVMDDTKAYLCENKEMQEDDVFYI